MVVQGWHTRRSDLIMDAMVALQFWACSKQSHKGRRGRSLTGSSKEAGGRHIHRRCRRMDAQGRTIDRPVKMCTVVYIVYQFERCFCLPFTTIVPPLAHQWCPLGVSTTVPSFSDHDNPWATMAMVLPPLCLLCATGCATSAVLVVQVRPKVHAAAVTQKQNFLSLGDH